MNVLYLKNIIICDTPTQTASGFRMIFTDTKITDTHDYNMDEFDQ